MSPTRSLEQAPPPGVTALPGGLGWTVTDRSVAVRLLGDDRLGVVESGPVMAALSGRLPAEVRPLAAELTGFAERIMLQAAPQRHAELRKAFGRFFTADAVAAQVPAMRGLAERIITRLAGNGGCEFMTEVAFRYAIDVGAHLVGLPPAEFGRLHKTSQRLALVAYAARLPDPAQAVREGHEALVSIRDAIQAAKADAPAGSVLGAWHRGEIGGLSEVDFEANAVMLVQASLETVAGMLGNTAARLLAAPGALADSGKRDELIDEALRAEPPLKTLERMVREPVELDGFRFEAGQVISVRVAEANRLGHPGDDVAGRAVLSFGWGAYRCLGARLARHQAQELFAALHRIVPGCAVTGADVERVRHLRFDMPRKLPVSWTVPLAGLEEALTDALAEHDLDRPLSSVERVVAATVLTEFGRPRPEPTDSPHTIREWVTWANLNHG
jgi:cytochrome P450